MRVSAAGLGLVLAGGRSRRMGLDKAGIRHPRREGKPFGLHACEVLRDVVERVLLVRSLPFEHALPSGVEQWSEPQPGSGPARALVAASAAHPSDFVVVAPCDMPELHPELYAPLFAAGGPSGACYAEAPLVCYLPAPVIGTLRAALDRAGDRHAPFQELLCSAGVAMLPSPADLPRALVQVNTPRDLLDLLPEAHVTPSLQGEMP